MSYDCVLLRYGELSLKGKNKVFFENRLVNNIRDKMGDLDVKLTKTAGRIFLELDGHDLAKILDNLGQVFGLSSFSPVLRTSHDLTEIENKIFELVTKQVGLGKRSFKVASRRADRSFELTSLEMNIRFGEYILQQFPDTHVDLHNPEMTICVEVRNQHTYVYTEVLPGLGGLTVGMSGHVLLLLSGGIDSPVAGYLALKRGAELSCIYFHSHPYTTERAKQKVIDLAKILTKYGGKINLYIVPFTDIQLHIREKCHSSYMVTIIRRMMMRLSTSIADKHQILAMVTGESLGQVASQTLESIYAINAATHIPVLRPLIGMDKSEIIDISKKIGTYETSILPYEDCCTLFLPKAPKTKPSLNSILQQERRLEVEPLLAEALDKVEIVTLDQIKEDELDFIFQM